MKYVDSSAFVKYYSDESVEKGADKVKEIVDSAKGYCPHNITLTPDTSMQTSS